MTDEADRRKFQADDTLDLFGETEEDLGAISQDIAFEAVIAATDWTTETILNQIVRKNVELSPEFQRRDAWDRKKKSRFIESLIVGLPIPQIVLAERKGKRGEFIVLDGKQRLLALQQFYSDGGSYKLAGLDLRYDLNGKNYRQLPEMDRSALDSATIRTIVVRNWQNDDFLYLVFLRLNTESVSLSPQELRQALHPGSFVRFVNQFTADNSEFYSLFGRSSPDFRMRDVEILVRFFAFRYFLPDYVGNLKPLLDATCMRLNERWDSGQATFLEEEAISCRKAIAATRVVFKENSFRRWNGKAYERAFNRAIFDVLVFYAADPVVADAMVAKAEQVEDAFIATCEIEAFAEAVTTTTKSRAAIMTRLRFWGENLEGVLGFNLPIPTEGSSEWIAYS